MTGPPQGASRSPERGPVDGLAGSSPVLSVRNLTTVFDTPGGQRLVVDAVSFEVRPGETLCLVGESGSGKSMTAASVLGVVPPPGRVTAGEVLFRGRNLLSLPEEDLRRVRGAEIGLIFQEPSRALNPVFTVGAQLAETLLVHGRAGSRREARAAAVELLRRVRMPDPERQAREYSHHLSGGLRQRAAIALAIACAPVLLIGDEPTSALDVTVQAELLDLLRDMRDTGLALLLITHDLGVVAEMADRVAVMRAGRIVEDAPVRDLFHDPRHPYTRSLLAAVPGRTHRADIVMTGPAE